MKLNGFNRSDVCSCLLVLVSGYYVEIDQHSLHTSIPKFKFAEREEEFNELKHRHYWRETWFYQLLSAPLYGLIFVITGFVFSPTTETLSDRFYGLSYFDLSCYLGKQLCIFHSDTLNV